MGSNQRPDTLMQDRRRQFDEIFLQRAAGPYIRVIRAIFAVGPLLPIYPQLQTCRCTALTDAMGQPTHALRQIMSSCSVRIPSFPLDLNGSTVVIGSAGKDHQVATRDLVLATH